MGAKNKGISLLAGQTKGERKTMDYKMVVEIPITNIPSEVSIQEAKVVSEVWLKGKIPDAELIRFYQEEKDER